MTNIFEQATRTGIRFATSRGLISTEQLWAVPLTSKDGFDLDTVARAVNADLKGVTEESFVAVRPSPAKALHELRLEVVKHIIAVKLAEKQAANDAAARKAEKDKLVGLLADKQDEALKNLTPEELQARIKALG